MDGIVTRLNSQLNLVDERVMLRKKLAAEKQRAQNWTGFSEKPPYSVLMVDELQERMMIARAKVRGLESTLKLIGQQVAGHRESARRARERERQAAERIDPESPVAEQLPAQWRRELATVRARNWEAVAAWSSLRHEVLEESLGIARAELDLLERQVATARRRMVFGQADLNTALAHLKGERTELEQEMDASLVRDARINEELVRIQRGMGDGAVRGAKGNGSAAAGMLLEARHRATLAWAENSRFATEVISALLTINHSFSSLWEKRYAALKGDDPVKRRNMRAELRTGRESLAPWLEYAQHQLEVFHAAERGQQERLSALAANNPLRSAEQDLLQARRTQREQAERMKSAFEQADIRLKSWQEDLERVQEERGIFVKIRDGIRTGADILQRIWHFELFAVEDAVEVAGQKVVTTRGVTVGKSIGAILLFLAGYCIISFLGRRLQRAVVARFAFSAHQANILHRAFLSVAILSLLFITLNLAQIPLTVFAFLGGALAIGVGFGTQTLIKNLISGILIMLERKVQMGDTVDVDGVVGSVMSVGIRASTVLGFDGVETVIPNATFLETKVTNWTHTNARLRRSVRVGVAYGSPATRVRDILAECAGQHGLILRSPEPFVLFEDFGDSSLVFSLYFWIEYGPDVSPLQVASDLRFMIERRFREERIVMAFPQRDIHVSGVHPLRVELVRQSETKEES
jgi:small-conductance mechanosensitive channel